MEPHELRAEDNRRRRGKGMRALESCGRMNKTKKGFW